MKGYRILGPPFKRVPAGSHSPPPRDEVVAKILIGAGKTNPANGTAEGEIDLRHKTPMSLRRVKKRITHQFCLQNRQFTHVLAAPHLSQMIHERIAGSQLRILEGTGHVALMEAPEAFAHICLEFLHTVVAAKSS